MGSVNIKAAVTPLIPSGTPSPLRVSSPSLIRSQNVLPSTVSTSLALDIDNITRTVNNLHAVQQKAPAITELLLTNAAGQVTAAFGNTVYQGVNYTNFLSEIHVGNPLLSHDPTKALFNANLDGSVTVGQNGWIDVHDPFDGNAAWIGTQYDTLPVTGAADNGSGAIRLEVIGQTLATGNNVRVLNMQFAGVPNATGIWAVTVIDANHVDLDNSVFSGVFAAPDPVEGIQTQMPVVDRILQISNVSNSAGLIRIQTAVAHDYESGSTVNISAPGPGGVTAAVGQWTVTVPATLAISAVADNGSGLIRLTVPGGNYITGDRVQATGIVGVTNANGRWTVTAITPGVIDLQGSTFIGAYISGGTATYTNARVFDLVDSVFAGAYTSGGTVLQFFAGMLAQTVAVGSSFQNYRLRAFLSGDLRIRNASIELTSASGSIVLDPTTSQIILTSNSSLAEILLDATVPALTFFDQVGSPTVTIEILTETPLSITGATNASPVVLHVPGSASGTGTPASPYVNGDTVFIRGAIGNTVINGYRIIETFNSGAQTFTLTDLEGHVINSNGVYAGSATCTRYYAGLLAQTLALGSSFADYRLRFFADGTLKINDATIDSSTITNATITGSFSSFTGTVPNVLTLTINNGTLLVSGTGTQAGKGIITIDQLAITGQTPAPTAPAGGTAILFYNTGAGALQYNLGGAGWVSIATGTPGGAAGDVQLNDGASGFTGSASLNFAAGTLTVTGSINLSSGINISGAVQFTGGNSTGAGAALLGANSPATVLTSPYKWVQVLAADNTVCYVPIWK